MESAIRRIQNISQKINENELSVNLISSTIVPTDNTDQNTNCDKYKYSTVLVNIRKDKIAIVTLNRPKANNAFSSESITELTLVLRDLDKDDRVHCIVITGNQKAFCCGADLKELQNKSYQEMVPQGQMIDKIANLKSIEKPMIAAVNGYALGGGCELAMICDIIICGENAKFSQPEVKIGTIPGAGGTQRLIKAVGKSKAMELTMTGRMMNAQDAKLYNLVSQVVPESQTLSVSLKLAQEIASLSLPIIKANKLAVNKALDLGQQEGLEFERAVFVSTFAFDDRREGMNAFATKRAPKWTNH
ncbi:enoyl-CoA hydratase [Tieghemostelium lacteum]|uniref:Enoyl-CoA hydratase n=1 Tax=Tieghemostelium lacteum TaxID=361077 RepID=A0A151Z2T8_TIELA|nr:enoyl-CoA hydratase [Tieghemostelium lacteum]|eukprot:KYQ88272.1 enoyl-CoA hydratase [Tieghemostelium lacteum]